jgi:ribosome assembly protein YihI (activator of Der GTPase)
MTSSQETEEKMITRSQAKKNDPLYQSHIIKQEKLKPGDIRIYRLKIILDTIVEIVDCVNNWGLNEEQAENVLDLLENLEKCGICSQKWVDKTYKNIIKTDY